MVPRDERKPPDPEIGTDPSQWLKLMAEQLPAVAWILDKDLILKTATGAALATLKIDLSSSVGTTLYQFIETNDPTYPPIAAHLRVLSGESVRYEHVLRGRTMDSHVEPLRGADGTIVGCVGVALDITERKQAEIKRTESEERLRLLMDALPVHIAYVDSDLCYRFSNKISDNWFHKPREELVGRPIAEVLGRKLFTKMLPNIQAALNGQVVEFEHVIRAHSRNRRFTHVTLIPHIDEEQTVRGYYIMAQDITDRKRAQEELECRVRDRTLELERANEQLERDVAERERTEKALRESEERLRQIAESVGDVFWLMAGDLQTVEYVSSAFESIWGQPCERLYAQADLWIECIHPDDRDRVREIFIQTVLDGAFDAEYRVLRSDGSVRWIRDRGFPIFDDAGNVQRVAGVAVDITEPRHAEQTLRESEEVMRRNERLVSIGTFAAGIAHEINNPLGAIVAAVGAARRYRDRPQGARILEESLELIKAEALRCSHIVKRVLRFSREQVSPRWPACLQDVVRSARELTRSIAENKGVTVRLELPRSLPLITMNPTEVEQVLVNLISNAIEASPKGAKVRVRVSQKGDESLQIIVRDRGVGMSNDQISRMFDPFYTTRSLEGGTGLGLTITHSIVSEHHGTINVHSKPGEGTRVTVNLPICETSDADPEASASQPEAY